MKRKRSQLSLTKVSDKDPSASNVEIRSLHPSQIILRRSDVFSLATSQTHLVLGTYSWTTNWNGRVLCCFSSRKHFLLSLKIEFFDLQKFGFNQKQKVETKVAEYGKPVSKSTQILQPTCPVGKDFSRISFSKTGEFIVSQASCFTVYGSDGRIRLVVKPPLVFRTIVINFEEKQIQAGIQVASFEDEFQLILVSFEKCQVQFLYSLDGVLFQRSRIVSSDGNWQEFPFYGNTRKLKLQHQKVKRKKTKRITIKKRKKNSGIPTIPNCRHDVSNKNLNLPNYVIASYAPSSSNLISLTQTDLQREHFILRKNFQQPLFLSPSGLNLPNVLEVSDCGVFIATSTWNKKGYPETQSYFHIHEYRESNVKFKLERQLLEHEHIPLVRSLDFLAWSQKYHLFFVVCDKAIICYPDNVKD